MTHKDEIYFCKTCDRTVSESHPLFSQRMKNPAHNVVKYLPSSSVKELVEVTKQVADQLAKELAGFKMLYYKGIPATGKSILNDIGSLCSKLETSLKQFEEEK